MLTAEEKREIEEELEHYADKRAACVEAMKIVQKHRGYVSDESINDLAELLGMTLEALDSVATFYNLIFRKPVGRHVVLVCDSVSCWIMGYDRVREHLTARLGIELGGTTPDGQFTLLPVPCLGACDHAPAMMIDSELYGGLTDGRIDEILEKYNKKESDGTTANREHKDW